MGCVCTQPTTAFKPKTLYNLIFTSMAVVTVPVPSDDDILGWTRESLEGSPVVARLRPVKLGDEYMESFCSAGRRESSIWALYMID